MGCRVPTWLTVDSRATYDVTHTVKQLRLGVE